MAFPKTEILESVSKALDKWAENPLNRCVVCDKLGYRPIFMSYDEDKDEWIVNGEDFPDGAGWLTLHEWDKKHRLGFGEKRVLLCPNCRLDKELVPKD